MNIPNIKEVFKQYRAERHLEDKGKHYNEMQETFANTELFDMSFLKYNNNIPLFFVKESNLVQITKDELKDFSLPFESQFIETNSGRDDSIACFINKDGDTDKVNFNSLECVFMREFKPDIITGTVYYYLYGMSVNVPFTYYTRAGRLTFDYKGIEQFVGSEFINSTDIEYRITFSMPIHAVLKVVQTLNNLPKHSVVSDTPSKSEYYPRKHNTTIKTNKPIYYVLGKDEEYTRKHYNQIKPIGHLTFDHSFKVRGHWRTISPDTYGKNRHGEYVMTGVTWVKEHIRGEGDLVKRIRVVKA